MKIKRPGRLFLISLVLVIVVNAVTAVAESRYDLGPDATFGLLMGLGMIAAFVALRIVEGPFFKPPPRDGDER